MTPRPASGFRFSPPPLAISPATRWALLRAFGPPETPAPAVDPEEAWTQAALLDVAPRIGSRVAMARLSNELGESVAERFVAARRQTASTALRYEQLAADLVELATERKIPIVFLKGLALQLGGYCSPGERPFGDLDCLARAKEAHDLFGTLVERGFAPAEVPPNEQHLPPLAAPVWGAVDLHLALRGVWHPGGEWWTADLLLAEGRAQGLPTLPGAYLPDAEVLAAHALVHALDQHGLAPGRHGLLRMIGDAASLLPGQRDWDRFLAIAGPWIAPTVSAEELAAARELTLALAAGDLPADTTFAGKLLSHFLATATDPSYGQRGRWHNLALRLRRAAERGGLVRYIRRKLRRRR
ncbi:MAG: nucleotidyltransferase family protein [Thermoanaerobaculia bacterium]